MEQETGIGALYDEFSPGNGAGIGLISLKILLGLDV
jgi:hypothetical protein